MSLFALSIFPGQGYQRSITAAAVRLRWRDLRLILGITGLWNYDLRRTLASCLSNELHVDDVTIRAILNHSDGSALSHYCFKSFDSLTGPIQAYADWVWNLPGTIPEPEGRLDRPRVWDEDAELMEVPG